MKHPTHEEVEAYVKLKKYNVDAFKFWSYYASVGWKVGKKPMTNWKIALGGWNHRNKKETPPSSIQETKEADDKDLERMLRCKL